MLLVIAVSRDEHVCFVIGSILLIDYYVFSHVEKKTSWIDPRLEENKTKKLEDCDDDGECGW